MDQFRIQQDDVWIRPLQDEVQIMAKDLCDPEIALKSGTSVHLVNIQHTVTRYFQVVHPRCVIITNEIYCNQQNICSERIK